jgi:3',5'-cyclic AMP phosphodiesterase CpdA
MVGQIANSHVRAFNEIAAEGSPVLDQPLDLMLTLGDLADNQQYNEVRYFVDTFDGNKLIDPDSGNEPQLAQVHPRPGGDGYDGVQGSDPTGSNDPLPSAEEGGAPVVTGSQNPLDNQRLLDLANEPFYAPGLRYPDGSQIPWYALPGNHDVKVQGTIFDDNAAWRALVRKYATGHIKLMELAPDYQSRLCGALEDQNQEEFASVMQEIIADPFHAGTTKVVPADPDRMPIYRSPQARQQGDLEACGPFPHCDTTWVQEQAETTGLPAGHGYAAQNRCTDAQGNPLARLCYSFVEGDFLFIGLDTSPPEGLERGSIDPAQFDWMERTIKANSSHYFDANGNSVVNPDAEDKLVVVYSHHPTSSLTNTGLSSEIQGHGGPATPIQNTGAKTGAEFENMLLHYPNVIMHSSGHTHENNIWVHKSDQLGTGYYEVNTASVSDMPSESRMFEIADNNDGTLSIFSTIVEGAAPPNVRDIDWSADDPTRESELVDGARDINESWLASFGREVGYHDPQQDVGDAAGSPEVRNVELLLPAPFDLSPDVATSLVYSGETSERIGRCVRARATLMDALGAPIKGALVTFSRGSWSATDVTNDKGQARVRFLLTGSPGTVPLTIGFGGSDGYLPAQIDVPFTARTR